jgi:hypothetical protein
VEEEEATEPVQRKKSTLRKKVVVESGDEDED